MAITPNEVIFEEVETLVSRVQIGLTVGFTYQIMKDLERISDRIQELLKENKEQQNAG